MMRLLSIARASALLALLLPLSAHADLARGDAAWSQRSETLEGRLAVPDRIEQAMDHYRSAVEARPDSLEARWKLLRALHFSIDFTTLDEARKDSLAKRAIDLAETSIARLDGGAGSEAERARVYFWSAIAWGVRAQRVGLLTVVREGAAGQMRDYAERSRALDPSVDRGGALRLLSRLHATLPRVPFLSGWVDRDRALEHAERAHALDADHPGNRLILALALRELAPERGEEATRLLESVANVEPRPDYRAEDLAIREQARTELDG